MPKVVPKFIAKIISGRLVLQDKHNFEQYLNASFKNEDLVNIVVRKHRRPRTSKQPGEESNQNGYYWGIVLPVLAKNEPFEGWLTDEIHEALKHKFMRIGGTDLFPKIQSTTELDTFDWEEKMEEIRIYFLTEHGVEIPLPNEAAGTNE